MTQKTTSETRQPSPLIRWAVIAAAAVPATLAAGTMLGGSPWTASAQETTEYVQKDPPKEKRNSSPFADRLWFG